MCGGPEQADQCMDKYVHWTLVYQSGGKKQHFNSLSSVLSSGKCIDVLQKKKKKNLLPPLLLSLRLNNGHDFYTLHHHTGCILASHSQKSRPNVDASRRVDHLELRCPSHHSHTGLWTPSSNRAAPGTHGLHALAFHAQWWLVCRSIGALALSLCHFLQRGPW